MRSLRHPGAWAVLLFRLASGLHHRGLRPLSRLIYFANAVLFHCDVAPGVVAAPGLAIGHPAGVTIGHGTRLGAGVVVMQAVSLGGAGTEDRSLDGVPEIGDGCILLDGARIFGPVSIGDRSIVSVNSWVNRDVPADVVVAGWPARVVGPRLASESPATAVRAGRTGDASGP